MLPGYVSPSAGLKSADTSNGRGAISSATAVGWALTMAYSAFCELIQDQSACSTAAAGDLGYAVPTSNDPAEDQKELAAEIAIIGFLPRRLDRLRVGRPG